MSKEDKKPDVKPAVKKEETDKEKTLPGLSKKEEAPTNKNKRTECGLQLFDRTF